jgi:HAMP domain-containing protein
MPGLTTHHAAVELILVTLVVILVVSFAILAYRAWRRSRVTAEERERRRCARLVATGKINDAMLVEIRENLVFYSYLVRGVEYTASQDIGRLVDQAAVDFSGISAMSVKYDARNPADSIVVGEEWSGLRGAARQPLQNHATEQMGFGGHRHAAPRRDSGGPRPDGSDAFGSTK